MSSIVFEGLPRSIVTALVGYLKTGGRYYDSMMLLCAEDVILKLSEEEQHAMVVYVRSKLEVAYTEKNQEAMEHCYIWLRWITGQFRHEKKASTPVRHMRTLRILTFALQWSMEHVTRAIEKDDYSSDGYVMPVDTTASLGCTMHVIGPKVTCNWCGEFADVGKHHEFSMCMCGLRIYCMGTQCRDNDYDEGHKFVCARQPEFWSSDFSRGVYPTDKALYTGHRKTGNVHIQMDANKRFSECMDRYFETGGMGLELHLLVVCYEWYWDMNAAKYLGYLREQKKLIVDAYHRKDWVTLNRVYPYFTWVCMIRGTEVRMTGANARSQNCIVAFHISLMCSMEHVYRSVLDWGLCEPIDFTVETIEGDVCMKEPKEGFIMCDGCGQIGDPYTDDGKEEEVKTGELCCMYYCSLCKLAKYCSHKCQLDRWKRGAHKTFCRSQPAWWRDAFLDGFYVKQHRAYKSKN